MPLSYLCRPRVSHVARVAQERSDAAASTVPSSTDRPAAPSATGSDPSSSHVAAGAAAVVAGAGLSGFPDGQHFARHGFEGSMQGVPVAEPPDRAAAAALAGNGAGVASQTHSAYDQQGDNGTPSSSGYEDLSYISSGFNASSSSGPGSSSGYMNRQWAGETSSSSSQPGWQPPNYRRSGLRLRSKRVLQVAEKLQQSGRNLIAEELQSYMASSTSSSTEEAAAAEDRDEHLDAFIEQMLCPKTSVWKRSDTHAGAATDSREAIDPDLLANIHTAPLEQVRQQQEKLVGNGQLLAALSLLEEAAAAGRRDVMHNTAHKAFLRAAGGCGWVVLQASLPVVWALLGDWRQVEQKQLQLHVRVGLHNSWIWLHGLFCSRLSMVPAVRDAAAHCSAWTAPTPCLPSILVGVRSDVVFCRCVLCCAVQASAATPQPC